jgi:3-ketosteroid 9alpha-monooxygenase subunit B
MTVSSASERPRDATRDHGFHPVRVSRVIAETSDAVSIALDVPPELQTLFGYRAGQFVTFRLTIDGQQLLRSYSMSSSPEVDGEFLVTVKRVPGGAVSTWLTETLAPGHVIESTRPAGVFVLRDDQIGDGREIVAFAGGSGVTPVFSLLKTALATTGRSVRLLYANRDPESVIFREQLEELAECYDGRFQVAFHLDSDHGLVDGAQVLRYAAETHCDYYICGPGPFMDLVESTLHNRGVDTESIHIERFTPAAPLETSPPPAAETVSTVTQITITLNGKTQTAAHRPGTTVLQTARSMGMVPPFSCEAGDCATCMAMVLEGGADMFANNALLPDEVTEGWILTCQAVPTTPTISVEYGYDD